MTEAMKPRKTRPGKRSGSNLGRPSLTSEQIVETRERIVTCALALFRADGYAGISMRRLASEAGCTPMTLYKYFASKFDILRMLWRNVFEELFDRLDALAAAERDPSARLRSIAEAYVAFWLEDRDRYFLVFMSGDITQDDVTDFMSDLSLLARFDLFRVCMGDVLGARAEPDDVKVRAEALVCGLNGVSQALTTMASYPWAAPAELVKALLPSAPHREA